MILTCPACDTRYVVKDGSIPPGGRQVRCASCKHSWHQDPEAAEEIVEAPLNLNPEVEPAADPATSDPDFAERIEQAVDQAEEVPSGEPVPELSPMGGAPSSFIAPPTQALDDAVDFSAEHDDAVVAAASEAGVADTAWEDSADDDDDFRPFAGAAEESPRRRWPLALLILVVLIGALAAAFWFLAPVEWRQRVGIAGTEETPLLLQVRTSDRQTLASGNELFAVSGRVINPTDRSQRVPPLQAELRNSAGKLIYSWTIAPPARTLPPGASASFNSAEVNVPQGADQLTVTLGSPAA
ncbi:MAG TPA: zinc-ribbon domain-containing protein [Sphingomicrobium sp.]|nr:zinc-ribbon domain-containing protein [Sphingomicrobium sp.]